MAKYYTEDDLNLKVPECTVFQNIYDNNKEMKKNNTGYPSIDKPWLKYYTESARNSRLSSKTMYKYLFDKNADHMDQTALLYFGRNISYKELIENIKRAASSFYKMGVRKGDVVSFCTVTVPEVIYSFYGLNMIGAIGNMIDPRTSVEGIAEYINRKAFARGGIDVVDYQIHIPLGQVFKACSFGKDHTQHGVYIFYTAFLTTAHWITVIDT